nr:hypothetical protein [Tanacetum cinerariifolium]
EALDTCAALARPVEHLEHDKVAQDLDIIKLKTRVKKLERTNKGRMIDELDKDESDVLMNEKGETEEVRDNTVVAAVSETVSAAAVVPPAVSETVSAAAVVPTDPEEESSAKTPTETMSKDKGKGIMVEEPKLMKKKQQVELGEAYARKLHEELNQDIDWEVAIDHVKQKAKEDPFIQRYQIKEEANRAIESINETPAQKAAKRRRLNEEAKIAMFGRPDGQDQIWKNQKSVRGQAMVKSWKMLQSCSVHIIIFSTTQIILLIERRYPLSRFTLDQMLNTVRLQVEEQSEMSLELIRFTRQQLQEGQHT